MKNSRPSVFDIRCVNWNTAIIDRRRYKKSSLNWHVYWDTLYQSSIHSFSINYSKTLDNEYIERIHQMSYSSLSDNEMLQIFRFLIK